MPTIKIKPKKPTRQKTSSRITRSGKEVSKSKRVRGTGKSKTVVKKKVVTSPKGKTLKYKTKVKSAGSLEKSKRKGTPFKAGGGTQAGGKFKSVSKTPKHTGKVGDRMVNTPKSKVKERVNRKGKQTIKRRR